MSENKFTIKRVKNDRGRVTVKTYSYDASNEMPKFLAYNEIYLFRKLVFF